MTWAYDAARWLSKAMTRGKGVALGSLDTTLRRYDTTLRSRDTVLRPQSAAQKLQSTLLKSQDAEGVLA